MTDQEPAPFDRATRVSQSPRQVHCLLGDAFVLMDTRSGEYFELNRVGSRLWREVAAPVSIGTLVNLLLGEYDVDAATCESEVQAWVRKMQNLGFLDVESAGAGGG